jgi:hypothetical protein
MCEICVIVLRVQAKNDKIASIFLNNSSMASIEEDEGAAHSNMAAPKRTRYVQPASNMQNAIRPNSSSIYGG